MDLTLFTPKEPEYETTGYKIRHRREELGISAKQLERMSGVSKGNILKAERVESYLNPEHFFRICTALQIVPDSIIDNEYKFFYQGYGQVVLFLIEKMGFNALQAYMKVQRATINKWKTEEWLPHFEQRRILAKKFNEFESPEL